MKQYHDHLKAILANGTRKAPAREGMPGSLSLFGYQNRYNLQEGFPILTTKKINFKNIVTELLWFLRGDTNIKYLVDNSCNIWNEDAYNYYLKLCKKQHVKEWTYETWLDFLKENNNNHAVRGYKIGDTGKQYPWLWRSWEAFEDWEQGELFNNQQGIHIDQVQELIEGLKKNPMSRRHIITAWNPATLDDMALNACHAFVQFNCRALTSIERYEIYRNKKGPRFVLGHNIYPEDYIMKHEDDIPDPIGFELDEMDIIHMNNDNIPKYYLDCQLYQRSADMFLGVPFNISSYALLTEIIAKIVGMIPGEFIHTFGDSHIYDNHQEQVIEILSRDVNNYSLPKLIIEDDCKDIDRLFEDMFWLQNYQSYSAIKAKLSTGLK